MENKSMEMAKLAIEALKDKKAEEINCLDISELSVIADIFLIAAGSNPNQVRAMCDNVREKLGRAGYEEHHVEGLETANWILLDYGDLIVHLFDNENRKLYNLERLWRDGKQINIED